MPLTTEQLASLVHIPPAQLCLRSIIAAGIPLRDLAEDVLDGRITPVPGEHSEMFMAVMYSAEMKFHLQAVLHARTTASHAKLIEVVDRLTDAVQGLRADLVRQSTAKGPTIAVPRKP